MITTAEQQELISPGKTLLVSTPAMCKSCNCQEQQQYSIPSILRYTVSFGLIYFSQGAAHPQCMLLCFTSVPTGTVVATFLAHDWVPAQKSSEELSRPSLSSEELSRTSQLLDSRGSRWQ
jgi:hypothetical protein